MKPVFFRTFVGAALLGLIVVLPAQDRTDLTTREIMKQKLDSAQSVLEGISLENYAVIEAQAVKLRALTEQGAWRVDESAEYMQQSAIFRRNVLALEQAAKQHNLDGATLAYTKVVFSCVECHKYLRGRKVAFVSPPSDWRTKL